MTTEHTTENPVVTYFSNAERHVACWNACHGLNPAAVPGLLAALKDACSLLTSVRCALATHVYECGKPGTWATALDDHMARTTARAYAAIAKAKEGVD